MSPLSRLAKAVLLVATLSSTIVAISRADEPTGRWKGRWSSGSSGHSGPMRARITPSENGTYKAVFAGRFVGVIPFLYRAEIVPVQTWDGVTYTTDKKLPLLGSYRMQTAVTENFLKANWSAVGDTGQVQMRRLSY